MTAKRVEPSARLFDPSRNFHYTNSVSTDLAKKFKAMRAAQKRAERPAKQGKGVEVDPRQQTLALPAPDERRVVSLPVRGAQ